jgi:hypothetical protein
MIVYRGAEPLAPEFHVRTLDASIQLAPAIQVGEHTVPNPDQEPATLWPRAHYGEGQF